MSSPVVLIAKAVARRMLVDTQRGLLDLAAQIGKGEQQERDDETVMLLNAISARMGDAAGLLFDSEGPAPKLADI